MAPRTGRQPTPLGKLILTRMSEVGMAQQNDLSARAGVANSTISRLIYQEQQLPHVPTLWKVENALGLEQDTLVIAVARASMPPTLPDKKPMHVLAVRLDRALSDPHLDEDERTGLEYMFDQMLLVAESKVRRARRDAGPS